MAKKTFNSHPDSLFKNVYIPELNMYTEAKMNESDYMAISSAWKHLREQRFARDGQRCANCGSPFNLEVHHRKYPAVWGKENLDDLVTLCNTCHQKVHKGGN